jgi:hypothetical protein
MWRPLHYLPSDLNKKANLSILIGTLWVFKSNFWYLLIIAFWKDFFRLDLRITNFHYKLIKLSFKDSSIINYYALGRILKIILDSDPIPCTYVHPAVFAPIRQLRNRRDKQASKFTDLNIHHLHPKKWYGFFKTILNQWILPVVVRIICCVEYAQCQPAKTCMPSTCG